jgi:hypothetical protein
MAWTTPRTWTTGEVVTAAMMNTHVRDNLLALFSRRFPHTYSVMGTLTTSIVLPPFFVPEPSQQSVTLRAVRHRIASGTSVTLKLQRNGTDITDFSNVTVTTTSTTTTSAAGVPLADGDMIQPVITAVSNSPQHLSLSIYLDYDAA